MRAPEVSARVHEEPEEEVNYVSVLSEGGKEVKRIGLNEPLGSDDTVDLLHQLCRDLDVFTPEGVVPIHVHRQQLLALIAALYERIETLEQMREYE